MTDRMLIPAQAGWFVARYMPNGEGLSLDPIIAWEITPLADNDDWYDTQPITRLGKADQVAGPAWAIRRPDELFEYAGATYQHEADVLVDMHEAEVMLSSALAPALDHLALGNAVAAGNGHQRARPVTLFAPLIATFDSHGGHCDCEVLMNVDPSR